MAATQSDAIAGLLGASTEMTDHKTERDDDEALAAEYVMGLISSQERRAVEARIDRDHVFAAQVSVWEAYFAGLNEDYGTVTPSRRVKTQIDKRLFATQRAGIRTWISAGLATVMTLAVVVIAVLAFDTADDARLVAELDGNDSVFRFSVSVEDRSDAVDIALTSGTLRPDQVFELWLIGDDGSPRSLGTFNRSGQLPVVVGADLQDGTVLAVSLEPLGGSPTGSPTGPVIATGALGDV